MYYGILGEKTGVGTLPVATQIVGGNPGQINGTTPYIVVSSV